MKAAALVPCRTGSKGMPNKNFRDLCGKPLWKWTVDAALDSHIFEKIIISSDGGITNLGTLQPIPDSEIIIDNERPKQFATDKASLDPLLIYYSKKYPEIELWCLLQPTSPLRTVKDIQGAYKKICNDKYDSLVTVTPGTCMYWIKNAIGVKNKTFPIATYHIHKRPNRQDRAEWFREVGLIYFTKKYVLVKTECRLGGAIALYNIPKKRSFSINDEIDWPICEMMLRNGKK